MTELRPFEIVTKAGLEMLYKNNVQCRICGRKFKQVMMRDIHDIASTIYVCQSCEAQLSGLEVPVETEQIKGEQTCQEK